MGSRILNIRAGKAGLINAVIQDNWQQDSPSKWLLRWWYSDRHAIPGQRTNPSRCRQTQLSDLEHKQQCSPKAQEGEWVKVCERPGQTERVRWDARGSPITGSRLSGTVQTQRAFKTSSALQESRCLILPLHGKYSMSSRSPIWQVVDSTLRLQSTWILWCSDWDSKALCTWLEHTPTCPGVSAAHVHYPVCRC